VLFRSPQNPKTPNKCGKIIYQKGLFKTKEKLWSNKKEGVKKGRLVIDETRESE